MARILVAALPYAGHAGPLAAVAEALVGRGHEVVGYTGGRYRERFAAVGATPLAWTRAPDFDDRSDREVFPRLGRGSAASQALAFIRDVEIGTAPQQAADIEAEHARAPFDLLVSDRFALGSGLVSRRTGLPWATVDPMARQRHRRRDRLLLGLALDGRVRRAFAGTPPGPSGRWRYLEAGLSPLLNIAPNAPSFEYPDLPDTAPWAYVGRLAATPAGGSAPVPEWWAELVASASPIVLVTQGSLHTDPSQLLLPTIRALAGRGDVRLVATTGGGPVEALGELPDNVRAASWLPIADMLPHVRVVVSNGGWGSVLEALEAGIPLVVAGGDVDKPANAARVAWAGAGIDLRTGRPSDRAVGEAVDRIIADDGYRARAGAIGAQLRALGGAARAADLLEALLR